MKTNPSNDVIRFAITGADHIVITCTVYLEFFFT